MKKSTYEIERKFLVDGAFPTENVMALEIRQGYLCSEKEHVVRVRIVDERSYLTVKGPDQEGSFTHLEVEKEISLEEGEKLLQLCEHGIIHKKRYLVPCTDGKHTFEVDVFLGQNEGLVLAEIELEDENECFPRPKWLGEEVTGDYRFSNSVLRRKEAQNGEKKIVYIDMDGVLVDFESGVKKSEAYFQERYKKNPDLIPGVFSLMEPMPGAMDAIRTLSEKYDLYILSTASWHNPMCWMEKRQWVGRHFGETFRKKLILTHRKDLNRGDYLIDDRDRNGASEFQGELIPFASPRFPDWQSVVDYLMSQPV